LLFALQLFYGMSSKTAMDKHHGGVADYRASEGKTVKVLLPVSMVVAVACLGAMARPLRYYCLFQW
jgi:hypothetical protein